jgi:hypothetical protein
MLDVESCVLTHHDCLTSSSFRGLVPKKVLLVEKRSKKKLHRARATLDVALCPGQHYYHLLNACRRRLETWNLKDERKDS